jgi:AcrR family transcriptional regulator
MSATDRKSTQRERLIAGMIAAANRDGYAEASVSRVIAHAGVSRPTFYDYFADRDDCFLNAHRDIARGLLERIRRAIAADAPERAVQAAIATLVEFAAEEPARARFLMNETLAGGPRALDERDRTIERIVRMVERARAKAPPRARTPDLPVRAVVGAVHWLLAPPLRRGERDLTELGDDLSRWIESYEQPFEEHRWRTLEPGPALPPSPHVAELSLSPPAPLPAGKSRLSAAERARNQRTRILFATAEVGARKGYTATTVIDITTAARVDRRVFYSHFRDKQQAFLATHELGVQQTMAVAASAFFSAGAWPDRIWEGIRASAHFHATYHVLAHIGYVESYAVGSTAVQRVEDGRSVFTIFLQEGAQHAADAPSRTAMEAIAAAIAEIAYRQARGGHGRDAPRLACHAAYLILTPFLGPQATNEFIDRKLRESGIVVGQTPDGD